MDYQDMNEADKEDADTAFRMYLPVKDLENLALMGRPTPVSGDALAVYGPLVAGDTPY